MWHRPTRHVAQNTSPASSLCTSPPRFQISPCRSIHAYTDLWLWGACHNATTLWPASRNCWNVIPSTQHRSVPTVSAMTFVMRTTCYILIQYSHVSQTASRRRAAIHCPTYSELDFGSPLMFAYSSYRTVAFACFMSLQNITALLSVLLSSKQKDVKTKGLNWARVIPIVPEVKQYSLFILASLFFLKFKSAWIAIIVLGQNRAFGLRL